MNLGWLGVGRLGLACSFAMARYGKHDVVAYDTNPAKVRAALADPDSYCEQGLAGLVGMDHLGSWVLVESIEDLVSRSDVVFVAVQTPHDPRYGGEKPAPGRPVDFEYGYLIQAVRGIAQAAERLSKPVTVAVVSTVLPGTTRAHLKPLCGPNVRLVYSPSLIAQSTTIRDFTNPEMVIVGADNPQDAEPVRAAFAAVHSRPHHVVSIESAELLKVVYNTTITAKISIANMVMEICHKTGADCDEVAAGLEMATDRVASGAYFRGGLGDSGACHPRDLQAMSWLAGRLDLSANVMGGLADARERQSEWLASTVGHWARLSGLPVMILGKAYKPNIALTYGSAALLLAEHVRALGHEVEQWDPHVDRSLFLPDGPHVFVVATRHDVFLDLPFPADSVVVDPFGFLPDRQGVTLVAVGRKR